MNIKILYLVTLWCSVSAYDYRCSKRSALSLHKRPAYEFSIKLLQRISQDTDSHFVFSPLSTWMQLIALAEGATDRTYKEIWNVTKHHRHICFKNKLRQVFNDLNRDLKRVNRKKSIIAIDELMAVKKSYIRRVEKLYGIKVLLLNFNEPKRSAAEVNHAIEEGTGGQIDRILYMNDFDSTVLLMSDANYFSSEWSTWFNPSYTTKQPFYSSEDVKIGEVSMMNQKGYFNMSDMPHIGAKVLELPCANRRITTLIFLPTNDTIKPWVGEIFYTLERTRLTSIFNLYKRTGPKLVNVSIPKFEQRTEFDNLPELLYDMGIKRIFNPEFAEFRLISDYNMYASLMTQISEIKVNERGILASAEFMAVNDTSVEFKANKPFAYMVVDRITQFILYAGVYSIPSVF